jgi:acyl carrier protein
VAAGEPERPGDRLRDTLATLGPQAREARLLTMVRTQVAATLGHAGPDGIDRNSAFLDLGFDSLTAVDLRNRLVNATGVRLPAAVVFDRPTPLALARYLHDELAPAAVSAAPALLSDMDALAGRLKEADVDGADRDRIADRLRELLAAWTRPPAAPEEAGHPPEEEDLNTAGADALFALIDNEFGGA